MGISPERKKWLIERLEELQPKNDNSVT